MIAFEKKIRMELQYCRLAPKTRCHQRGNLIGYLIFYLGVKPGISCDETQVSTTVDPKDIIYIYTYIIGIVVYSHKSSNFNHYSSLSLRSESKSNVENII